MAAAADRTVRSEHETLVRLLAAADPVFHSALVRERSLWKSKAVGEVIRAIQLAMLLEPGCAAGRPLRAVSLAGIDSKFFEHHRSLIVRLLDLRFDGEASRQGLEPFLNAGQEQDNWLLLADLGAEGAAASVLCPFRQLRVRASDLAAVELQVRHLLVVENERCLHLLPRGLDGTLVVLGAGNNLQWLNAPWVRRARVAYWGDIDTWGLALLARALGHAPHLIPLLMTLEVFARHDASAVHEAVPCSFDPPAGLTLDEIGLYKHLLSCRKGRLEQEFIGADEVHKALQEWTMCADQNTSA